MLGKHGAEKSSGFESLTIRWTIYEVTKIPKNKAMQDWERQLRGSQKKGYVVAIPLTDSQDYDLIVDVAGLKRVQVKTTTYKKKSGNFFVSLTIKGGNRSGIGKIKKLDETQVDEIFVLTSESSYLIPVSALSGKQTITLCCKYDVYKI